MSYLNNDQTRPQIDPRISKPYSQIWILHSIFLEPFSLFMCHGKEQDGTGFEWFSSGLMPIRVIIVFQRSFPTPIPISIGFGLFWSLGLENTSPELRRALTTMKIKERVKFLKAASFSLLSRVFSLNFNQLSSILRSIILYFLFSSFFVCDMCTFSLFVYVPWCVSVCALLCRRE